MRLSGTREIVTRARRVGLVVPGFNIPYLPMMKPVVAALRDCNSFGLIMVARLEWLKFQSGSLAAIRDEYERCGGDSPHTRLHLDHVPVIDEDNLRVDFLPVIAEALEFGYNSVMIDGSRLPLAENIACTREVAILAHGKGVPVEAELGAVLGHEAGPLPPYEELFRSRKGFTSAAEAATFVAETGCDWLSVAVGNIHGAISEAGRQAGKIRARIDLDHLRDLEAATRIPLVLHGGTGIDPADIRSAVKIGIAKINIATAIRRPYEQAMPDVEAGQRAVYQTMVELLETELELKNSADLL